MVPTVERVTACGPRRAAAARNQNCNGLAQVVCQAQAADLGSLSQLTGPSHAILDAQPGVCGSHLPGSFHEPRGLIFLRLAVRASKRLLPIKWLTINSQVWPNLCKLQARNIGHCKSENLDQTLLLREFCLEF